jgi:hypothetical protein
MVKSLSETHPDFGVARGPVDVHRNCAGSGHVVPIEKLAVTDVFAFMVSVQDGDMPEHAPLQPTKAEPLAAAAVRVTLVPLA